MPEPSEFEPSEFNRRGAPDERDVDRIFGAPDVFSSRRDDPRDKAFQDDRDAEWLPAGPERGIDDRYEQAGDASYSASEWDDEQQYAHPPLQFSLRALFAAFLLTGFFALAYLYARLFGFLLFFSVAAIMGARARRKRERMVATMFFGGAAALCGGLMMAESSRAPVALFGLLLACLGGYATLHGLALVASSFWE